MQPYVNMRGETWPTAYEVIIKRLLKFENQIYDISTQGMALAVRVFWAVFGMTEGLNQLDIKIFLYILSESYIHWLLVHDN